MRYQPLTSGLRSQTPALARLRVLQTDSYIGHVGQHVLESRPKPLRTLLSEMVHPISIFLLLSWTHSFVTAWTDDFIEFLPDFNAGFQLILRQNCSAQYAIFREDRDRDDESKGDPLLAAFSTNSVAENVIQCLLEHTPEIIKVKMGTSQVRHRLEMPIIMGGF